MRTCSSGAQTLVESDGQGPACSVVVAQASGDPGGWALELRARFDDASDVLVRRVVLPPSPQRGKGRVVAVEVCPGAVEWRVLVDGTGASSAKRPLRVGLHAGPCGSVGTRADDTSAGSKAFGYDAANAVVQVPPGAVVLSIGGVANAAGATVDIDGGGPLPVPVGAPFGERPDGSLVGPATITFAGGFDAHYVSWRT